MSLHNPKKPLVLMLMLHGCNEKRYESRRAAVVYSANVLIPHLGHGNFISKPQHDVHGFPIFNFLAFVDHDFGPDFFINEWYKLTEKDGLKVATSYERYSSASQIFIDDGTKIFNGPVITLQMDVLTAMCVIAQIQLAARHEANNGSSQTIAGKFARLLQRDVVRVWPDKEQLLEQGWNPQFDH